MQERCIKLIELGVPYQEAVEYEARQGKDLHVELVIEDNRVSRVIINGTEVEIPERKMVK